MIKEPIKIDKTKFYEEVKQKLMCGIIPKGKGCAAAVCWGSELNCVYYRQYKKIQRILRGCRL